MVKKRLLGTVLCVFLALFFLVPAPGWAKTKTFTFNFQMAWHTRHPEYFACVNPHRGVSKFSVNQGFVKMMEKAGAKLGYKIRFILYPADQLVKRKMALDGLKAGTLDMLQTAAVYFHGMVPEGDVDWMPYVTSMVGRAKAWDFFDNGKMAKIKRDAYIKKANAMWFANIFCGGEGILSRGKTPVKSMEDIKGEKLRAAGGLATRTVDALGASPVTMATGEVYPALQRGVLDGLIFPVYGLRDYKFIDYCKAVTLPPIYIWCDELWMNKKKFDSLPPDLQKAFMETARKWARWASTEYWPAYEAELNKWAKKKGCVFYTLPKKEQLRWKEAVAPVWNWYAKESPGCAEEVKLIKDFMEKTVK